MAIIREDKRIHIRINRKQIKIVECFKYLGVLIQGSGKKVEEISEGIDSTIMA